MNNYYIYILYVLLFLKYIKNCSIYNINPATTKYTISNFKKYNMILFLFTTLIIICCICVKYVLPFSKSFYTST